MGDWWDLMLLVELPGDLTDPVEVVCNLYVDARYSVLAAANTPADNSHHLPAAGSLAHHRATAVTLPNKTL